jgi:predicted ArsR family transcriptional regulator
MSKRMERWICSLVDALDEHADKETRSKVLERCGRQCQSQRFVKKARSIYEQSQDTDEFLDSLGKIYEHLHREGDHVYIIYPTCFCSFVNKIPPQKLSATYCNCSRGWAKALFEGALGRPAQVTMEKSIINGDDECKFRIIL